MKMKTLSLLAGVSAPLIMTASSDAGFLGVKATVKDHPLWLVVNVYAIFDRPGTDHMIAVTGTPNAPLNISVQKGTFYQHAFGTDRPPGAALVAAFPELAFDSFVTIGVKVLGPPPNQPTDAMLLTPTWPGFGPSTLEMTTDGWAVTPENAQGNPFDAVNSFPGNGQVLIGQFTSVTGTAILGTFRIDYVSNNKAGNQIVSFFAVPTPGVLALLGMAGLIGVRRRRRR